MEDHYRVVVSGIDSQDTAMALAHKLDMQGRREAGITITVEPERHGIPPYDEGYRGRHREESL